MRVQGSLPLKRQQLSITLKCYDSDGVCKTATQVFYWSDMKIGEDKASAEFKDCFIRLNPAGSEFSLKLVFPECVASLWFEREGEGYKVSAFT